MAAPARRSDPDYIPKAPRKRLAAVSDAEREEEARSHEEELDAIKSFADHLKTDYLQCREMNHTWRPYHVGRYKDGGFQRTLRCTRCKTRKIQDLTSRGGIVRSWYEYPEGYQREKGQGRILGEGRDLLRLASISRLTINDIDED